MKKYLSYLTCLLLCGYLYSDTEVTKQRIGSLGPDDRVVMDVDFSRINSDTSRLDSKIDTLSNHTEQVSQNLSDQITTNSNRVNDAIITLNSNLDNAISNLPESSRNGNIYDMPVRYRINGLDITTNVQLRVYDRTGTGAFQQTEYAEINFLLYMGWFDDYPYKQGVNYIDGIHFAFTPLFVNRMSKITNNVERLDNLEKSIPNTVSNIVTKEYVESLGIKNNDLDTLCTNLSVIVTNLASRPYAVRNIDGSISIGIDDTYTNLETVINFVKKPQDSIYNNIGAIITNLASRPYITKDSSGNLVLGIDEAYTNLETVINIITK